MKNIESLKNYVGNVTEEEFMILATKIYMITDLTRYFRKTLDIYQDYISDKTEVAKRLYDDIIKSLNALQSVKYM